MDGGHGLCLCPLQMCCTIGLYSCMIKSQCELCHFQQSMNWVNSGEDELQLPVGEASRHYPDSILNLKVHLEL